MRIGLITPDGHGINPGSRMITAGIRYLLRRAVPDAVFVPVNMLAHDESWQAAPTCDVVVLCGNPRFSLFDRSFWECDIWEDLRELQVSGVKVIDGWSGATHPWTNGASVDDMADELLRFPRTVQFMDFAGRADGRITRDPVMQAMYRKAGVESAQLPCSSWWAAREYRHGGAWTGHSLVTVLGVPSDDRMSAAVRAAVKEAGDDVRVISSVWLDFQHMRELGITAEFMPDPEALLSAYWQADRVIAFRLHSAIPAASMGCKVSLVAVDSRATAADAFGIPITRLEQVGSQPFEFGHGNQPDESAVVGTLRAMLS